MPTTTATPVRDAMLARRSWTKVTDDAPSHEGLVELVAAAGRCADHANLRPWRLIELRGDDRVRLGEAIGRFKGSEPSDKPLRAPLLIAIVAVHKPNKKVPEWEQDAAAAGVAHALSLLLDEAGYGVVWRTGDFVRSPEVAEAHGLADGEKLLGWLYVGGKLDQSGTRRAVDGDSFLGRMP